jgi:hypothetical protein
MQRCDGDNRAAGVERARPAAACSFTLAHDAHLDLSGVNPLGPHHCVLEDRRERTPVDPQPLLRSGRADEQAGTFGASSSCRHRVVVRADGGGNVFGVLDLWSRMPLEVQRECEKAR